MMYHASTFRPASLSPLASYYVPMRKYAAIIGWVTVWILLSPIALLFIFSRIVYYGLGEQRWRILDDLERQLVADVGAPLGYLLVLLQPLWLPLMFVWIGLKWCVQRIVGAARK